MDLKVKLESLSSQSTEVLNKWRQCQNDLDVLRSFKNRTSEYNMDIEGRKQHITKMESDIELIKIRIHDDETRLAEEINRRDVLMEKLSQRAKIRCELTGVQSEIGNSQSRDMDARIEEMKMNIKIKYDKIESLHQDIQNERRELIPMRDKFQRDAKENEVKLYEKGKEADLLYREYEKVEQLHTECQRMVKEEKMKQQYIDYAKENGIDYKTDDELIEKCNQYRQEYLLNGINDGQGWFVDEGCPFPFDEGCDGWYTGNHRCECGSYKGFTWNSEDFDPTDILQFDITSDRPYGSAEKMW